MLIVHKHIHGLQRIVVAGAVLGLAGCGSGSQVVNSGKMSSGNFSGTVVRPGERAGTSTPSAGVGVGVSSVTLSSASVKAGESTEITVHLRQAAPSGGMVVELRSSDASVLTIPATLRIPSGQTSATIAVATLPVSMDATVSISALYADTVSGTSLRIAATTNPAFTVAIQPSAVTIAPGKAASVRVTTKVTTGYNHALPLTVLNVPAGVAVSLTPPVIPAPGAGSSKLYVAVPSSVVPGTYLLRVRASDGKISRAAGLTLKVASANAGATFEGCWYKQSGHRYQGARISVANPGTYPFDAVLYRGARCDPNNVADEFGYGTLVNFGGFGYIFWFADFGDQSGTSALWHVGTDTSQCVNYSTAPDC